MEVGSSLSQALVNETLNQTRKVETRIAAVRALRKSTASEVCKTFKVSRRSLFRWKAKWEKNHDLSPLKQRGSSYKLTPEEQQLLLAEFNKCPSLTNMQAAAIFDNRINHRTVSDYLKRSGYSRKLFSDEQETYANGNAIQLVKEYCAIMRSVPLSRRVYVVSYHK
jgi:transposase